MVIDGLDCSSWLMDSGGGGAAAGWIGRQAASGKDWNMRRAAAEAPRPQIM